MISKQRDVGPVPINETPGRVRVWFDAAANAAIPDHDGTLGTARQAADAYARHAKAENTRLVHLVRGPWSALPASAADIVACLAAERGRGISVTTLDLRRAAIRYLHFIAGLPVPTAEARVAETMAGIHREAAAKGQAPVQKLAATIDILRQILAPIGDDLVGLRDRALLLIGFAGARRRAEVAAIRVEHLEARDRGLRLTLPHSNGERTGKAATIAIPYGTTTLYPVRAFRRWQDAAAIAEGPIFQRIWLPPSRALTPNAPRAGPVGGPDAIDAGTVTLIVKSRAESARFDPAVLGGHSLKRGAMTTGMDRGVHPTRLKQIGGHKTYAVLDTYLELGDPFEGHPLSDVM